MKQTFLFITVLVILFSCKKEVSVNQIKEQEKTQPVKSVPTLQANCSSCLASDSISFSGSGYTSGHTITAIWTEVPPRPYIYYRTNDICTVDGDGNISFKIKFADVATWEVDVYQSRGSNYLWQTYTNVTVQ